MAREPREHRRTDAQRIARKGTGKAELRERLEAERRHAIEQLRRLGGSPEFRDGDDRSGRPPSEEGDAAQASERQDMSFAHRERLAARINEITAALERLAGGSYGICEICGNEIEPNRLAALPAVRTCLACQARAEEQAGSDRSAA